MVDNNYFEFVKEEFRKEGESCIPVRATQGSAGYDFITPIDFVVPAYGYSDIIFTDIKAHIKQGYVLMLFVRSSVGFKKHCILVNGTGIIDEDYFSNPDNDGNIGFKLFNTSDVDQEFKAGEKVVQGIFVPYDLTVDDYVENTRIGGIGSTGE